MASDPAQQPSDTAKPGISTRTMTSRDSPILISSLPPAQLPYPVRPRLWDSHSPTTPMAAAPTETRKDLQTRRCDKKDARPADAQFQDARPAKRARSMSPTMPLQQPTAQLQQASTYLQHPSTHLQEPHKRPRTGSFRLATTAQGDENVDVTPEPALSPSYGPADHSFHRREPDYKTPTTPVQIRKRSSPSTSSPTTPNTSDSLPLRDSYTCNEILHNVISSSHTPSKSTIVPSQKFVHYTEEAEEASTSGTRLQPVPPTALAPRKRSSQTKEETS